MSFADQVRRMAENDEPKCKNCKHWGFHQETSAPEHATVRICGFNSFSRVAVAAPLLSTSEFVARYVTDLSLCSAWEHK